MSLLQAGQVGHRDACQLGKFFAPQARHPTASVAVDTDFFRGEPVTARTEELTQFGNWMAKVQGSRVHTLRFHTVHYPAPFVIKPSPVSARHLVLWQTGVLVSCQHWPESRRHE